MASPPFFQLVQVLVLLVIHPASMATAGAANSSSQSIPLKSSQLKGAIKSTCEATPHPELCMETLMDPSVFISIPINPTLINFAAHMLDSALTKARKLSSFLADTGFGGSDGIVQVQKGCVDDCKELHHISMACLQRSASICDKKGGSAASLSKKEMADINIYLSAALTNKNTCLQGLSTATGPKKDSLVNYFTEAYKYVSNSLAIVAKSKVSKKPPPSAPVHNRRLMGAMIPSWLPLRDRRVLQLGPITIGGGGNNNSNNDGNKGGNDKGNNDGNDNGYDNGDGDENTLTLKVSADGSETYRTVSEAVLNVPEKSDSRTIIQIKAGVYEENVEIPSNKMNIAFVGEGSDVTTIRGNRSVVDGWTTFHSATVAVSGQGFLARDITFENYAGPAKGQAVAIRINADLAALYHCNIIGYQDTLYVHSFRQFYRECNILGTVDFIFGNSATIIQKSNIIARLPLHGQYNTITAQGRDDPNEDTGISIQRCSILASQELAKNPDSAKTYLGRPWRVYSRTVYMDSLIDDLVDPSGWKNWDGDKGLDTLYYGEYANTGPGSSTDGRVNWPGYHIMDYEDASQFTVPEFIEGDQWLDSTSFPYDNSV